MTALEPVVGNWYKNVISGERFEVVATDDDTRTVEIQHFEGEIEEFDMDVWWDLQLSGLPPQEDRGGPFEDLEQDDVEIDGPSAGTHRGNPLDELD